MRSMRVTINGAMAMTLGLGGLVLAVPGNALARGDDNGRNVCYKEEDLEKPDRQAADGRDQARVVLNVDQESPLTFPGGYPQTLYTALGKVTETNDNGRDELMAPAQGTIVVASKGGSPQDLDHGAHLGLVAVWVRPDNAAKDYECTSDRDEESATPRAWNCAVRDQNEGVKFDRARLTRLDRPDRYCGVYQDDVIENRTSAKR